MNGLCPHPLFPRYNIPAAHQFSLHHICVSAVYFLMLILSFFGQYFAQAVFLEMCSANSPYVRWAIPTAMARIGSTTLQLLWML
jgi:hypothetical protein